jgi:signal transduction histidine kinase
MSPDEQHSSAGPEEGREQAARVVVVDDDAAVRAFLRTALEQAGHAVRVFARGDEALAACEADAPQVVVTDLVMEPVSGEALLQTLRVSSPSTVPVVVTGHGTVETAVELMRLGAFEVLTKPCTGPQIVATVAKALAHHRALETNSELRDRLRVQEKLAMIGKLAAGVAHELNNPLDAALRCIRLTRDRVNGDAEAREYLGLAETGLQRMADIVQGLLTFSRHAALEQAPQALDDLLEEAVASVALALADRAPPFERDVKADVARSPVPRGLHQVVVNLLRNACDAAGAERPVAVHARRGGDTLLIQVVDQGPGIPPSVLPRIFEPFFTTKPPGSGTGLGLPISARLVEKFGGTIRVECPREGGTRVTVTLPLSRVAVPAGSRRS